MKAFRGFTTAIILAALAGCASAPTTVKNDADAPPAARNIILFLGDGMGITTVTAARILEGQLRGETGEENFLSFERFDHSALAKTYNSNQQTPDSAGTISAIMTGVKTRAGVINIGPENLRGRCTGSERHALSSLPELARSAGLSTGVVTTARVTHATPSATYARSPDREWEADSAMTPAAREAGCRDIARQLLEPLDSHGHDIVLGGGRLAFLPSTKRDPEYPDLVGVRLDGRDLIDEWQSEGHAYVWNARQLADLDVSADKRVLGLFEPSHMRYELDRNDDPAGEPSLAEMTTLAIDWLQARGTGYVLLVEAGRIDHGHHAGNAARALHDTVALSKAVAAAREHAGDDTLIVVTADHSHVFSMGGYPTRGNPILGLVRGNDREGKPAATFARDDVGDPYTTLSYANGPGYLGASEEQSEGYKRFPHQPGTFQGITRSRGTLDDERARAADFLQAALVPLLSETHGGEDVPVYAQGPGSEHVRGVIEQNKLFRLMAQSIPRLRQRICQSTPCPAQADASWAAPPASDLARHDANH